MIKICNLKKEYGHKVIFDNYNFYLNENEYVIILGKSGQGKSTLLNIIGLLDDEYNGQYYLVGNDVRNIKDKQKSKLRNEMFGFIFQNYNLIDDLNVIDNIYLPYCYSKNRLGKEEKKHISMLIKEFKLDDIKSSKVKSLSGGEKQRVAIVRALVLNPLIIIADEPTGNLDCENEKIVMDFLRKMKEKGKSIVMVTHNLNIIKDCDRIIDLSEGVLLSEA